MTAAQQPTPATPRFADLVGKIAVVTGGSRGIGRASAAVLAENGCRVAIVARSTDAVEEAAKSLRQAGGEVIAIAADAADPAQLAKVRHAVETRLGTVDILLPYVGGFRSFSSLWHTSIDEWNQVIHVNLTSSFLALREFLPPMMERKSGSIVLMSSISARTLDKPTTASYAAAKAGVLMLMRHAVIELGDCGVRINAIAPATVTSERIRGIMDGDSLARTAALSPLGRIGTPEDCAAATAFLASEASGWITGITLDVAGGRTML